MSVHKPTITITLIAIELSNSVMQKNKSQMLPVLTAVSSNRVLASLRVTYLWRSCGRNISRQQQYFENILYSVYACFREGKVRFLALIHHSFLMFVVDIGLSSLQVHYLQCLSKCVHFRILVISDILEVCYSAYWQFELHVITTNSGCTI